MSKLPKKTPSASESPDEFKGLHRALMFVAVFFFIYLIVEATVLIPFLFMRYGMH